MKPNNMDATETLESLKDRLKQVEIDIKEVEKRMPAHSVKPPIMQTLFELEDLRDDLIKKICQLDGSFQSR
jgi:hypothetical protein